MGYTSHREAMFDVANMLVHTLQQKIEELEMVDQDYSGVGIIACKRWIPRIQEAADRAYAQMDEAGELDGCIPDGKAEWPRDFWPFEHKYVCSDPQCMFVTNSEWNMTHHEKRTNHMVWNEYNWSQSA